MVDLITITASGFTLSTASITASTFVEVIEKRQGLKIACLEGIAYRNGWIDEAKMRQLAQPMLKNQYGQYLLKVIDEMKEQINSETFTK